MTVILLEKMVCLATDGDHAYCRLCVSVSNGWITDRCHKSFPGTCGHNASSSGYFCDPSTTTDSTDDTSESGSAHGPALSGIVTSSHEALAPGPHYQFRKSNSMKLALKEDDEEGDRVWRRAFACRVSCRYPVISVSLTLGCFMLHVYFTFFCAPSLVSQLFGQLFVCVFHPD